MKYDKIEFWPTVWIALDSLRQPVRGRVLAEIDSLINDPAPRDNVRTSRIGKAEYVLTPVADQSLRIFFRIDETQRVVEVVDIMRPESLLSIARGGAQTTTAP